MFALIALICFILALFKVDLGDISLVTLGLAFVALHLLLIGNPFFPTVFVRRREQ